ncbi:MAG: DUF2851 family protein [Bacteroidales bacterium]|nr:DUF2851 family protein [Bacteroidales bacterium]
MNEEFLIYLWANQLFRPGLTTTNESVSIQNPGRRNTDSGPDFFNARIKIGNTSWAGNVEIHTRSSDWFRHGHQHDPAYNNIILHVVFEDDKPVARQNNELMPTIVLDKKFDERMFRQYQAFIRSTKWIACEGSIAKTNHFERLAWFDTLMAERLEEKTKRVFGELHVSGYDFHEVFYRELARNFGFGTNAAVFGSLAVSLPLKILAKHNNSLLQIEALLYGQAGLLNTKLTGDYPVRLYKEYLFLSEKYRLKPIDPSRWKFMRMRPANFPTIRISQFANVIYRSSGLLHKMLEADKLPDIISLFKTQASSYWTDHFRFGKKTSPKNKILGDSSINLLLINTVVPFTFVYGKQTASEAMTDKALQWLEEIKAENNNITCNFTDRGIRPRNAMQSQALIQLKNNYCDKKRCLDCRIGYLLLKS